MGVRLQEDQVLMPPGEGQKASRHVQVPRAVDICMIRGHGLRLLPVV